LEPISQFMKQDHGLCDECFVAAEEAAHRADWDACATGWRRFRTALLHHFSMEESVLFPAFETATGMTTGPTRVMRAEHEQMRGLLEIMEAAVARREGPGFLGHAEALLILMQQHNLKEESVLYPMTDRALGPQREALIGAMRAIARD
jgi:hemerythrin-like domain-containing protein